MGDMVPGAWVPRGQTVTGGASLFKGAIQETFPQMNRVSKQVKNRAVTDSRENWRI